MGSTDLVSFGDGARRGAVMADGGIRWRADKRHRLRGDQLARPQLGPHRAALGRAKNREKRDSARVAPG
jgi:hypothetical protein